MSDTGAGAGVPGWAADVQAALPGAGRVRTVAVEGRSGAGKSTVAGQLRTVLAARGEAVHVLTMEDLYAGWDGLAAGADVLCERVLGPLSRGEEPVWHAWGWEQGGFSAETSRLPAGVARGGVLIVEGTGSGSAPARALVDVLVWVHAPDPVRARRLDRRADAALYAPHRARWAAQEERFLALHRPDAYADVRVDRG